MIKAIVFDFGGIVVNNTDISTYEYIAGRFGIDSNLVVSNIWEFLPDYQTGKISDKEFWRQFSQNAGKELPSDHGILWTEVYSRESRKILK